MTKLHITKAIGSTSPIKKPKLQTHGQVSGETPTLLRTRLLQRVVDLLEQDDSMVDFVSSIVDSIGKVPLEQDTMRRAFLAQLNQEKKSSIASSSRSSGRPKRLNLHHCREFILACVNEIVDLEDTDPAFDYAESIAESDTTDASTSCHQVKLKMTMPMQECLVRPASPLNKVESTFDYCETLSSSSAQVDVATHLRNVIKSYQDRVQCEEDMSEDYVDDETFNKVRAYAATMAIKRRAFQEFKRQMPMEPSSPVKEPSSRLSRRLILHEELPTKLLLSPSPLKEYASKYNTFDKLKRNRANSPLNRQRKARAMQQLKQAHSRRHTVRQVVVLTLVVLLAIAWLHDEFQL